MNEIEITLKIRTTSGKNARFIRHALKRLFDNPSEWADVDDRSFFELLSRRNEMVGEAKLKSVSAARLRLPK